MDICWGQAEHHTTAGCLPAEQRQGQREVKSGDQSHFPQTNGGAVGSRLGGQAELGLL